MKGVSDMDAPNDKKIKGKKTVDKKPLQVLHISKKDTHHEKEEILDDNQSHSKELRTEIKVIKPQITEAPLNENKENESQSINFE